MRVLVTGSAGHLGEALVRTLRDLHHEVVGLDILASPFSTQVGSITDRAVVRHGRQDFVGTNISGTLALLEEAAVAGVTSFVYTSTTSVFGDALRPPADAP